MFTDIYTLRFIKPFDESYFISIAEQYDAVVFVEEGVRTGGISESLCTSLLKNKRTKNVKNAVIAFPDRFMANGTRTQILEDAGLSPEQIAMTALDLVQNTQKEKER